MSERDQQDLIEEVMNRLRRTTNFLWVLLAGAFAVGGWATLQQANISKLNENLATVTLENAKLRTEFTIVSIGLNEMKEKSFTFREAQAVTERLVVLETKFLGVVESFDSKLARLEAFIPKHGGLSPQPGIDLFDTIAIK